MIITKQNPATLVILKITWGGNFYLNILSMVCWIITAAALKGKAGENDKSYKEIRFNWIRTMASM